MRIIFNTTEEAFEIINFDKNQSLYDICLANKIPFGSVSFYIEEPNKSLRLFVGLYELMKNILNKDSNLIIQPNRNINFNAILNQQTLIDKNAQASTEYTFPSSSKENHHIELNPDACKDYVLKEVDHFLKNFTSVNSQPIIFGISGGGDSNTLLEAFIKSNIVNKSQIIAVMCLGIPSWDNAKDRATELCEKFDINLKFVTPQEICILLGKRPEDNWYSGFEDVFHETELSEVLGTLVIRLALQSKFNQYNAQAMITGLNLEDILAECYLRTMQGKLPLPFPIRVIENVPIWYPLYKIPKKILDGCYPKYSLTNYQQRINDTLRARAIIYYLAESVNSLIPGAEFDLINGYQKLSTSNKDYSFFDKDLGFSVLEPLNTTLKSKWKYFTAM